MTKSGWLLLFGLLSAVAGKTQIFYSLGDDSARLQKLQQQAENASDSMRSWYLLRLSKLSLLVGDSAKAISYLREGTRLAESYPFLKAASLHFESVQFYGKRDPEEIGAWLLKADSALAPFQQQEALNIRSMIWLDYGLLQQIRSSEQGAMEAFLNKALPLAREAKDPFSIGIVNKAIGILLMNADQRNKANTYFDEAIRQISRASDDNPVKLENLAELWIFHAENDAMRMRLDSARTSLDWAARILRPYPNTGLYLPFYYAEGTIYSQAGDLKNAAASFQKGIDKNLKLHGGSNLLVNRLRSGLYTTRMKEGKYAQAIPILLQLINDPALLVIDKKLFYRDLYSCTRKLSRWKDAAEWAEKYMLLSDSLYESNYQAAVLNLEARYQASEKENVIARLEAASLQSSLKNRANRQWIWFLSIISLLLMILAAMGLIYFRSNKKLAAQKLLNYQQQLRDMEQQQQLEIARALLDGEERERKRLAGDLHDGLGGMLAAVKFNLTRLAPQQELQTNQNELPRIIQQLDNSVNELRRIARNMMPETLVNAGLETALRDLCESLITDRLNIHFQAFGLQPGLPQDAQTTVYRMVQELLTNAIRHSGASAILVQCSQNKNNFYITVEDDGKGFNAEEAFRQGGMGLKNLRNRVEYLKGQMDIHAANGEGSTINIEFHVPA